MKTRLAETDFMNELKQNPSIYPMSDSTTRNKILYLSQLFFLFSRDLVSTLQQSAHTECEQTNGWTRQISENSLFTSQSRAKMAEFGLESRELIWHAIWPVKFPFLFE